PPIGTGRTTRVWSRSGPVARPPTSGPTPLMVGSPHRDACGHQVAATSSGRRNPEGAAMSTSTPHDVHPELAELSLPVEDEARAYKARYVLAAARIAIGWVFLWAFLDKTFGLGFATAREDAWINGGSPTFGFLNFATEGKL